MTTPLRLSLPLVAVLAPWLAIATATAQDDDLPARNFEGEIKQWINRASLSSEAQTSQVQLNIEGIDAKLEEDMRALAGRRIDYLLEPPATRAVADDLAFIFERLFHEHGYPEARIDWELVNSMSVRLNVDTGPAAAVGEVTITTTGGASLDEELMREILLAPSITSDDIQRDFIPFVERLIQRGTKNVEAWLDSQGYWLATVELKIPEAADAQNRYPLELSVDTGPLIQFGKVTLVDLETGESRLIQPAIEKIKGETATAERLIQFEQEIAAAFDKEGYYNTQTRFTQEIEGNRMNLTVAVLPGRLLNVGEINFLGYERTKRSALDRRFRSLKGTLYSADRFQAKLETLYRTGIFSRIDVEEIVEPDNTIDYTLTIHEGTSKRIGVSGGVSSESGGYSGIQYRDHNVLGKMHRFDVEFEYSALGLRGDLAYGVPWIFGDRTMYQARLFAIARDYAAYDKFEYGWQSVLEFRPNEHYKLSLGLDGAFTDISGLEIAETLTGPTDYYFSKVSINQSYDKRDDAVNPRKGWIAALNVDAAGGFLGSDVNLIRTDARLAWYLPLGDSSHIRLVGAGGALYEPDGERTVPIDQRFFQGGASGIRSFRERRGPPYSPSGKPIGGNSYKLASAELVGPIKGPVKFVLFADAGNVTESTDPLNFSNSEVAVGAGLRVNLPTGPIRLEYGHNMTHDDGETEGTLHFVIGISF
ncbi:BamA/OMP85 family outer membrane protein [Sulfuriroseicoccus oceanibius]|uniref:BamA/TamA family outer membrane protein n=1 Tax=Sulfuriroseicoccus oceanibius TaxID=2707525 RepID=A0A6B3L839_9BACT|nr:BamA/TamA family outer membrane protein [Sulfuriroseicoccus oceanibius]QQL44108.1 BamA/TamA family outer membrane protein [Sulfuriroseicoccus oceanibius]